MRNDRIRKIRAKPGESGIENWYLIKFPWGKEKEILCLNITTGHPVMTYL